KRNVDWTTGAYSVDTSKTPPRRRWTKVNMVCVDPHADTVYQALGYSHPYSPHVFSFAGHGWLYDMGGGAVHETRRQEGGTGVRHTHRVGRQVA
ncbi:MAG: hypothetical protein COY42_21505, partial [Armatimonadetes bacterium CG_4_10_14_0_8_um_filter_66_14]